MQITSQTLRQMALCTMASSWKSILCSWIRHMLSLTLCYHCLKILSNVWTRSPSFLFVSSTEYVAVTAQHSGIVQSRGILFPTGMVGI
jgi:hypothetical protein